MASVIDYSKFTFTAEQIRDLNELLYEQVLLAPEISQYLTVFPNIVFNKEVGYIGEGSLIGKSGFGCSPSADSFSIATRKFTWTPKQWSARVVQCFADLNNTAAVYSLKNGIEAADFQNSDIMSIFSQAMGEALKKFIIRLAWFNDTAIKNMTDNGTLKDGIDTGYFSIVDGLFKQIAIQCTANSEQKVTIAENAGTTYAGQAMNDTKVQVYLQKLYYQADIKLRQMPNNVIFCTQSFYDSYARSLQGVALESMLANLEGGKRSLTYNGIPLIANPIWDEMIANYFNNGTKLVNPHRALFTNKGVLGMAVDSLDSFENLKIWYENKDRQVYTDVAGKADVKLMNPDLFVYAE